MNCETCKEKAVEPVPYIVHEAAEALAERHIKRLIIALVIAVVLIFASNAAWLVYLYQYDFGGEEYSVELETDSGGNANYIGERGDIFNGPSESD